MKFILLTLNDTKKHKINKVYLQDGVYINEVSFSKKILEKLDKDNNCKHSIIENLKNKITDKSIEKLILKALEGYNKKWTYIVSRPLKASKYISNKAESMLGYRLNLKGEMNINIFKYIDEYLTYNKNLKANELKVLLVAKFNKNINFMLLNNLIKLYKNVNIFLNEKPSNFTLKEIKQINNQQGSTIDIVKKDKKALNEYNIVYFIDEIKENFPRLRLNKNAFVMDVNLELTDKFNSNLIYLQNYIKTNTKLKESIEKIKQEYEQTEFAYIVKEIINAS